MIRCKSRYGFYDRCVIDMDGQQSIGEQSVATLQKTWISIEKKSLENASTPNRMIFMTQH